MSDFEDIEASQNVENLDDDQRFLTDEELLALAKQHRAERQAAAPEFARSEVRDLADTEAAFAKQLGRIAERQGRLTQKEFEIWEDDFASGWKRAQEQLDESGQHTAELEADAVSPLMTDRNLSETIEAQAGNFYLQRNLDLKRAIELGDSTNKDRELETVKSFFSSVQRHIEYKYQDPRQMDSWEAQQYDRNRTAAHNNMIRHLNSLNDLARKYHTRPFTPRNFWTSDAPQKTFQVQNRMRHDRHQVEAYVEQAFTREVNDAKRRQERESRWY